MTLSQSKYDDLLRSYNDNRLKNMRLLNERRSTIYSNLPEIKQIDEEIASLGVTIAKSKLLDPLYDVNAAKENINNLITKKQALLESHGLPVNYLDPIYTCNDCMDTGFIDGKRCHCFKQAIVEQVYAFSNLKNILNKENFDSFNLDFYSKESDGVHPFTPHENAQKVLKIAKDFSENFKNTHDNLLIRGETGLGKTFLTNCIAKSILDKGESVLYLPSTKLFEDVLPNITMGRNITAENKALYNYVFDCDLLIIDDLGTELNNSFVCSSMFTCVNERLLNDKSTIISTNLNMSGLKNLYTERVSSRILDSYLSIELYGHNIRYDKKRMALTQ